MKKIKDLSGHSGCEVVLLSDKGVTFVRKISKDPEYNERLKKQMIKQNYFSEHLATEKISTPKIIRSGEKDGKFFFDMEYINQPTLVRYIENAHTSDIVKISNGLIEIIKIFKSATTKNKIDLCSKFSEKISSLRQKIPEEYSSLLNKLETLSKKLPYIDETRCHGDLTLENIIYEPSTGRMYLIDFQDIFAEHYWFDISIMFQDISEAWFFLMNEDMDPKTMKIKMDLLQKEITPKIEKLDKKYFKYHSIFVSMKFFRIIPYAEEKDHNYLSMVIQKHLGIIKKNIKPNLFIIGHPQSGVRSLWNTLRQHPEVCMSYPQEPNYFCKDFNKEEEDFYKGRFFDMSELHPKNDEEYSQWFLGAENKKIIGDASTHYLLSKDSPKEIHKYNSRSKIIIILREPIEFINSLFEKRVLREESVKDFYKALDLEKNRRDMREIKNLLPPISFSYYTDWMKYSEQIGRYLKIFDKNNLRIYTYEEWVNENKRVLKELMMFLEIDSKFNPKIFLEDEIKHVKSPRFKRFMDIPFIYSARKIFKKVYSRLFGGAALSILENKYVNRVYSENNRKSIKTTKELSSLAKKEVKKTKDLLDKYSFSNKLGDWNYK